ncbi:MAG: uracil-DNA glycosylase family protein, partial [Candidatus Thermoplasmatota archaeon]|nr:uracil-DNA glycosylase family protein [Candidatus Thermoplasmatota archaeon]
MYTEINKSDCPKECAFKNKKTEPVLIPQPEEIIGIIVSRDPTVDWLYKYLKDEDEKNASRKLLFASAIPLSLLTKIAIFMRKALAHEDMKCLFNTIFEKVYWTHMHKCCTDSKNKELEFKRGNAKACADKWLDKELEKIVTNHNIKFILGLGKHVEAWIEGWYGKKNKDVLIVNLPHPSGQTNAIWYRRKESYSYEEREKQIENLIELCKS